MKKVWLSLVCGLVIMGLGASTFARPPYKAAWDAEYGSNADLKKVSEMDKCNLCHFGDKKKNRNDYGMALEAGKLLNGDFAKSLKGNAEAEKQIKELFKKTEDAKAKDGTKFGDRLKAGKAPGTPE